MSREVKRVPLNFDWPIGQAWKGYLNPYDCQECKPCSGSGLNPATKKLSDDWYSHLRTDGKEGWGYCLEQEDVQALIDADRLWDFTRVPRTSGQVEIVKKKIAAGKNSWLPENNGYIPTAEEVNRWAHQGLGHDSLNRSICTRARAKRLGIYGTCKYCDGEGVLWQSENIKKLHDGWESSDPPIGKGWQMWEDCSEGSPISPVFKTPEELARWLTDNKASAFGHMTATYEQWLATIKKGYAIGMIYNPKIGLRSGVEANTDDADAK